MGGGMGGLRRLSWVGAAAGLPRRLATCARRRVVGLGAGQQAGQLLSGSCGAAAPCTTRWFFMVACLPASVESRTTSASPAQLVHRHARPPALSSSRSASRFTSIALTHLHRIPVQRSNSSSVFNAQTCCR
jgi:hypothetical protein